MSKYSKIYFIGIGGIGMSAIARYYKFKGYPVAGYDRTPSDLTHALEKEGIDIHYKDDPIIFQRTWHRHLSSIPRPFRLTFRNLSM